VGFLVLFKSADFFVEAAKKIGIKLGLSRLIIGLTIVAFGTSIPELFTGLFSVFATPNFSDFIVGTIAGSNIANILFIFGIFMVTAGSRTLRKKPYFDVLILFIVSAYFGVLLFLNYMNYILLGLIIIYFAYLHHMLKKDKKSIEEEVEDIEEIVHDSNYKLGFTLILSLILLFTSSKYLIINNIENIGLFFGIPISVLTLTSVAFATSLPELAVTISSARKGEVSILVGNILGSNIINICFIVGFSGFIGAYFIDVSQYLITLLVLTIATITFGMIVAAGKLRRTFGILYLLFYLAYVYYLFAVNL
jgi:cation:H+ antiporter